MNKLFFYRDSAIMSFSKLSPRDQKALLLLAGFLFLLFVWLGIWQPVENSLERNKVSYVAARNDYEWMQSHASQIIEAKPAVKKAKANPNDDSLLSLVMDSAQPYQVVINHAEPEEDGNLQLTIDSVAFKNILPWLEQIQNQYSTKIIQITLTRIDDKSGYIRGSLTLKQ